MFLCKNLSQKCVRLAVILFLFAAFALATQAQVVFSPPKNVSNSSGNTQNQQIAVDVNGNVSLVWADNSLGNYAIFFSRSSDAGNTFSTPRSISKHAQSTASGPLIAVDSAGNIDVVWTETSPDGSANFIYFSRSSDGVTFTNPQNISGDAGMATSPRIAVDAGGNLDVVWVDTSLGNSEIFFSRSADGGASFSTPLDISNDAGSSVGPAIAADASGNINVAWADSTPGFFYDVFFGRSSDGGATFSSASKITSSNNFVSAGFPGVASGANGNIYLLWVQRSPGNARPVFARSTDGGTSFSSNSFANGAAGFTTSALMVLDPSGNDIGLVAGSVDDEDELLFFSHSADAGASFAFSQGFSESPSVSPEIAMDAIGRFDISFTFTGQVFERPPETPCFCFAQSPDGNEFSVARIASIVPSGPTVIALDAGGNAYVAWRQSASSGSNANVFFSRGAVPPFSLSVSPTEVAEGSSSTGTVKLITPAPAGGAAIFLSSSNPSIASVPGSITVPAGASSATFDISGNAVSTRSSTTITAALNGSTNTVNLAVDPLFQISVFGNTTGGNTASGEITLSQPAPAGGLVISLSSSDPSVASVPPSVTVPAGSRFAFFNIPTSVVSTPTTVQITGTSNGFTHSGSFTVQP